MKKVGCKRGRDMPNMKQMIIRYMRTVALIMVTVILVIATVAQIISAQNYARESASAAFIQIHQIMMENQTELTEVETEYKQTCLHNAEVIAYMVEENPEILNDIDEINKIAQFLEVDEIHFFDATGRIFTGTHPEYYNLTMDSGEQIGFFKPMLTDKSLSLVQEVMPNTAESKPMQYSARWSENGTFIVQVGMEPVNVLKVTEKNELSYIFSLLRVNTGVSFYAIDKETGEIMGATASEDVGKHCEELGFDVNEIISRGSGFHSYVKGVNSFCVFTTESDNLVGRVVEAETLYHNIWLNMLALAICLLLIALILIVAVTKYMDKHVLRGIYDINKKLSAITEGNLDETVDVKTCLEFAELSSHSNEMIKSLLEGTQKISYVLNKTDVPIGVYEYNKMMTKVRFTEHVPEILGFCGQQAEEMFSDNKKFIAFIEDLKKNPMDNEADVYCLQNKKGTYLRLEELTKNNEVFGIVIDVTEEIQRRKQIEEERDLDLLTGLYNRRGLENRFAELFEHPEQLKHCAMVMVDTDCLKEINDTYGHDIGDVYLCKIAGVLRSYGPNGCVIARQGGDEFVLFLYQYENMEELENTIKKLGYIQDNSIAHLSDNISVPLRFSYGYVIAKDESDYEKLLKEADEQMYKNKRERKIKR